MITRHDCRLCHGKDLVKVLELGKMPHAGAFITKDELSEEKSYPLDVYFCKNCTLVQLLDVIPKDELFKQYHYMSSVSMSEHFIQYAKVLASILKSDSFVIEIGSNDGFLLKQLKSSGFKVLGIDPSDMASLAIKNGVETVNEYFTKKVAESIVKEKGKADLITSSNTFAHIDNLDEVMEGIKLLLKEDGSFVVEVHYLLDLIEKLQYDTIYHEHFCYYSLSSLIPFFKKYGMEICKVERIPIHAGSIRVYTRFATDKVIDKSVGEVSALEKKAGLGKIETYENFARFVSSHKEVLMKLLKDIKSKSKKIVGYGAAGRANTLMNYCGIDTKILDFIADDSPARQNHLTPGSHIPVVSADKIEEANPDYILILAWSFKDKIMEKQKAFKGKFIVPLPKPEVINR